MGVNYPETNLDLSTPLTGGYSQQHDAFVGNGNGTGVDGTSMQPTVYAQSYGSYNQSLPSVEGSADKFAPQSVQSTSSMPYGLPHAPGAVADYSVAGYNVGEPSAHYNQFAGSSGVDSANADSLEKGAVAAAAVAAPAASVGSLLLGARTLAKDASRISRLAFLLKIYGVVLSQLLLTFAFISVNQFVPVLRAFNMAYWWVGLIILVASIVGLIPLFCFRKIPVLNLVTLVAWTTAFGWGIGMSLSAANFSDICVAAGLTAMSVIVLSGSVIVTRADVGKFGFVCMGLGVSLVVLALGTLCTVLLSLFVPQLFVWWRLLICVFGALICSLYIVYDTSMILHHYSTSEWVVASVNLYLDIINLFIYLLRIVGSKK